MDVLVLSVARGLYFGKRLYLYPFSARVGSEGSGETVYMCSCFLAFGLYWRYGEYPKSHELAKLLKKKTQKNKAAFYIEKLYFYAIIEQEHEILVHTHTRKVVLKHECTSTQFG